MASSDYLVEILNSDFHATIVIFPLLFIFIPLLSFVSLTFLRQCHLACPCCVLLVCNFIGHQAPSVVDIWHDQFRPDAKPFVWPLCTFSHVRFLTQTTLCCLVKFVYFIKLISFPWSVIWLLWNKVGGPALLGLGFGLLLLEMLILN